MKILTKPLPNDHGPAFPNPLSTNHIVRALYARAQRHPWVVKIVPLQVNIYDDNLNVYEEIFFCIYTN